MHTEAVSGGHPGFIGLLSEMRELHVRKAADYGRDEDQLANVRSADEFGVPAWVGVMIRANDKVHRIKSFLKNGSLKNESVEDSLKDLAAYALIALVLFREAAEPPEPIDLATAVRAYEPEADGRIGPDGQWKQAEGVAELRCSSCDDEGPCRVVKVPGFPPDWACAACYVVDAEHEPETIAV